MHPLNRTTSETDYQPSEFGRQAQSAQQKGAATRLKPLPPEGKGTGIREILAAPGAASLDYFFTVLERDFVPFTSPVTDHGHWRCQPHCNHLGSHSHSARSIQEILDKTAESTSPNVCPARLSRLNAQSIHLHIPLGSGIIAATDRKSGKKKSERHNHLYGLGLRRRNSGVGLGCRAVRL